MRPEKLLPRVTRVLKSSKNELWLSPVSTWEFLILVESEKIVLNVPAEEWLREANQRAALREAPLTHEIAIASRRLDLQHNDPADHFIAATAKVLELTLITADKRLMNSRSFKVLPNR